MVDGSWNINSSAEAGRLTIGLEDSVGEVVRGAVLEVRDSRGELLAEADPAIKRLYGSKITGRWVRRADPLPAADPGDVAKRLVTERPELRMPLDSAVLKRTIDVVGVLAPEELAWRGYGQGWLFIVRTALRKGSKPKWKWKVYLARAARAGPTDLAARVPELSSLRKCRVAVAGLGSLGAPSAFEFARAGVGELRLLDHDIVDPGTAVRWPIGLVAAGRPKLIAVGEAISSNWPYTAVSGCANRLGTETTPQETENIDRWLEGATLIYDATAELGVQHFLSDKARELGIPYVCVWSQPGAWGGLVARITPSGSGGCWSCLQHALSDGTLPYPPGDPNGNIQPRGCADPTFTCSGFDLGQLAVHGVRMAVAAVPAAAPGAYPIEPWDVLVWKTRDGVGEPIPPVGEVFPLKRYPACQAPHPA